MLCAARAGRRGRRVLVIEHADEPGKKILISGGGRCNFTNLHCAPDRFLSANPHFCRSALARYTQHDFIALVVKHGIPFHEKTLGQLFCDGSARAIVAMLLAECAEAGVEVRCGTALTAIAKPDRFRLTTAQGDIAADSLVLATGGLSIPKLGATGFAHQVARQFRVGVTQTRPGLVPLTFGPGDLAMMRELSGVAVDVSVTCGPGKFREALLFTHRGLSGPAILQISSYWRERMPVVIDLLPGTDADAWLRGEKRARPKALPKTILAEVLPQRLAEQLAAAHVPEQRIGELADTTLAKLAAALNRWTVVPSGTEGFAKAEVTVGGVDTAALSSKTMAATAVPGLHFVGEAVDVTGWLGGYNFQWAWSSGWAAGEAV